LNKGRHLCSAGRPSGWALAHILVVVVVVVVVVPSEIEYVLYVRSYYGDAPGCCHRG